METPLPTDEYTAQRSAFSIFCQLCASRLPRLTIQRQDLTFYLYKISRWNLMLYAHVPQIFFMEATERNSPALPGSRPFIHCFTSSELHSQSRYSIPYVHSLFTLLRLILILSLSQPEIACMSASNDTHLGDWYRVSGLLCAIHGLVGYGIGRLPLLVLNCGFP